MRSFRKEFLTSCSRLLIRSYSPDLPRPTWKTTTRKHPTFRCTLSIPNPRSDGPNTAGCWTFGCLFHLQKLYYYSRRKMECCTHTNIDTKAAFWAMQQPDFDLSTLVPFPCRNCTQHKQAHISDGLKHSDTTRKLFFYPSFFLYRT